MDYATPEAPTTEAAAGPRIVAAVELPADIRAMQISMLQRLVVQLQADLAEWQPLEDAYQREMAGRAASGFKVEPRSVWVRDLARQLGGVVVDDAGAAQQWMER